MWCQRWFLALGAILLAGPVVAAQPPTAPEVALRKPADAAYPSGRVLIEYSLERPADRLDITVLTAKGIVVAAWSGVAAGDPPVMPAARFVLDPAHLAQGTHAVSWDLRATGYLLAGAADTQPVYSEGPPVPPGSYVVQLTALGQTVRETLVVAAIPALGPSIESDLAARFDLALRIRGRASAASAMLRQVRAMRARVDARLATETTPTMKEAGAALIRRLTELEGASGQEVSAASGAWPLQNGLAALAGQVEGGGRPTDAQASRYLELGNILQSRIVELNALISGSYAGFEKGLPVPPGQAGAVFGGAIVQLNAKGVDFERWVQSYVAALKQRWIMPPSAAGTKGRVVVALLVRKSGVVSGVEVVEPSGVTGFNESAQAAVLAARPAPPLPDAFPDDACPMKVTFYFNELPPAGGPRK